MSISPRTRIFSLTERFNLQYRAEFFNVFNHTLLNNPDTYGYRRHVWTHHFCSGSADHPDGA